jgi:serine phosphatase RsbU (regulator of sigma subunit)
MGRLRAAIQTLADLEFEPDELLTRTADLVQRLVAEAPPDDHDVVGATCLYAVYDPVTQRCTMASAGHPPPVLVRPDGTTEAVEIRVDALEEGIQLSAIEGTVVLHPAANDGVEPSRELAGV